MVQCIFGSSPKSAGNSIGIVKEHFVYNVQRLRRTIIVHCTKNHCSIKG